MSSPPPPIDPVSGIPDWPPGSVESNLCEKIRYVCVYIVRGQVARKQFKVYMHAALRISSIVLTALGGVGLIVQKQDQALLQNTGWAFWGGIVVLLAGIFVQIADVFGVERIATHASLLSSVSNRARTELGIILTERDPRKRLGELTSRIFAMIQEQNNHDALPAESPKFVALGKIVADDLIRQRHQHWQLPKRGKQP